MVNRLEIVARSTELDVLGHVNNARYLEYLEWGRFEWLRESGLPLDPLGASGIGTAIVNININFRKEARLGDRLRVETRLVGVGRSSLRLRQEVRHTAGDCACDAEVTAVLFDIERRRSLPVPAELRGALEALIPV